MRPSGLAPCFQSLIVLLSRFQLCCSWAYFVELCYFKSTLFSKNLRSNPEHLHDGL